jgi:hypothetical protein
MRLEDKTTPSSPAVPGAMARGPRRMPTKEGLDLLLANLAADAESAPAHAARMVSAR